MGHVAKAAALAAMIFCLGTAQAQGSGPVELPANSTFKHRHSKIELPRALAGLPRSRGLEYEADQLDTMSEYATPDLSEAYSVYIYRNVAGGVAVWFDRARSMLEQRTTLGTPSRHGAGAFVPPGRANASGLIATYALAGKGYRSTGLAMVPVGEWLVKMRASSHTLSPPELEARMKAVLGEIAWPKNMAPAPDASPVVACATGLALTGDAKPAEKDEASGAAMLVGALLGQMGAIEEPAGKAAAPAPVTTRWCRDSTELPEGAVYRAGEQADSYLIALGDAGRAVSAGRNAGQLLLEGADDKKPGGDRYEVQLILLAQTMTSALLDRLPPPAQALALVKEGRFATSFGTWGKGKGQITVTSDAIQ
ncbi:MAG TPA: hypothetical protein VF605_15890 [Allosphingosinicella sp.]|jgi:hypothetical protein